MAKKTPDKKKHITLRMSLELVQLLDQLGEKLDRSRSELIILAVRAFVHNDK
jgi:predicted transcriptional regulator